MRRAISLSALGFGTTSPNPPVGCVILGTDGQIVGQGYHERKGEPHAETRALAAAGRLAEGGTAVVTLEPCNHQGRTPPCRQALIDAKVARVVIAVLDPTSRGEGGAAALSAAGIDVEVGLLSSEARLVLGPWLQALETRRPYVTWAYVPGANESRAALSLGQQLREKSDAVLFEDGRVEEGVPHSHGEGILHLVAKPLSSGPVAVLSALHDGGVRSLLLSGGRDLAEPFLQQEAIDEIVLVIDGDEPAGVASASFLPPGFTLLSVEKVLGAVVAISRRT
jgi:diaminohydroxyphosphoribosylaminopyrimidine deaminase/5-amino-6-(5-phosphoribosylamino)uracil reductase